MPKITHAADGPTHHIGQTQDPKTFTVTRSVVGGERESVTGHGGNSSASSKSGEIPSESSSVSHRELAPTTESLSKVDPPENSTVSTTDGNGQETESQPSDKPASSRRTTKKAAPAKRVPRTTAISSEDDYEDAF
jgi:hypothetical protein